MAEPRKTTGTIANGSLADAENKQEMSKNRS
jgi:hypothetical protein